MATKKYLDDNGLTYYHSKVKTLLSGKADSSSLATVATSGSYNDLSNKPTIPTNNNQLINGAGYQTSSDVQSAINSAIAGVTGLSYEIVASLPSTGENGVIYLISNSGTSPNVYDEYIWVATSSTFEKIGSTDVDMSGYQLSSELVAVTNAEIDTIVAS